LQLICLFIICIYYDEIRKLLFIILGARESVIPGDRSEMNEFIEAATKNTLFKVELNLRFVEVSFPSKYIFEEIYNRYNL